ncbi:enoyl-CoA hydratase/isomerase family protein [Stenotrophomonas maltophilia]|uniref:enoyl-CoA hydratase/isomerase family protein n=1 Tax=Stenotrophomonas maltophilia TaxID=40324 RepID=UPI00066D0419|nr:enoyl-CoA hydratase/isomerase family protein [Stenotrophomonas maltophilia]
MKSDAHAVDLTGAPFVDLDHLVMTGQSTPSIVRVDFLRLLESTSDVDASIATLNDLLSHIEETPTVRIVVFTGLGGQAEPVTTALSTDQFRRWNKLLDKICDLHAMTIGVAEGTCNGRGFQLAVCCDFRLCTSGTQFSCVEARAGHLPGLLTYCLPTLVGNAVAKRIVLAGEAYDALAAKSVGLVDYVVDASRLETELAAFADQLSSAHPGSVQLARRLINEANVTQREAVLGHHIAAYHCCVEAMSR